MTKSNFTNYKLIHFIFDCKTNIWEHGDKYCKFCFNLHA